MTHTRLWIAATIIALVVIVGFVLSVPHTRDIPAARAPASATAAVPAVALHDVYKKGVHTLTGSLMAPDACSTVSASATPADNRILITIALENQPGICLEVQTKMTFQTTVAAAAGLPFTVTVNGAVATTTSI